jgi:hypothetical protein
MVNAVIASVPSDRLTDRDRAELDALEAIIKRGIKSFVEVGHALLTVRDKRLYRETSSSFDGYCRVRWELTRRHADRLIQAAEVVGQVRTETHGSEFPVPQNERQARALAEVEPEQRTSVWRQAVETASKGVKGKRKVTAAHVKKTVAKRRAANKKAKPTSANKDVVFDDEGQEVPDYLRGAFAARVLFEEAMRSISNAVKLVNHIIDGGEGHERLAEVHHPLVTQLNEASETIKLRRPHAVCPERHGETASCNVCGGVKWTTRTGWGTRSREESRQTA